tara:strand:+ start:1753 stop:2778 length:1026 start_codon:yes stop_codon:yes gene_type:complete
MIITDISLKIVQYNMMHDLPSSNFTHNIRSSWIIKITDNHGFIGYGEASPLPQFNTESLEQSGYCLEGFKLALKDINEDISLDELLILSNVHTLNVPSANFAIQTALYDLLSKKNNQPFSIFVNPNSLTEVQSNGIYKLTSLNQYKVIKVKCGFRNLYDEIDMLDNLVQKTNSDISFIIDLNQAYDLPKAIRFLKEIDRFNIKYVEQPLDKNQLEDLEELRYHSDIPIALDESVINIESINNILNQNAADIFILKPQSIGCIQKISQAVQLVYSANKQVIITSSLEGSIGRFATMHLVAINCIKSPCGLALEKIYEHEIHTFPRINNGALKIPTQFGLGLN